MATYENDRHFCGLPINDECVSLSRSQRNYDRKYDEKHCYVRRRIGISFEHARSPARIRSVTFTKLRAHVALPTSDPSVTSEENTYKAGARAPTSSHHPRWERER